MTRLESPGGGSAGVGATGGVVSSRAAASDDRQRTGQDTRAREGGWTCERLGLEQLAAEGDECERAAFHAGYCLVANQEGPHGGTWISPFAVDVERIRPVMERPSSVQLRELAAPDRWRA